MQCKRNVRNDSGVGRKGDARSAGHVDSKHLYRLRAEVFVGDGGDAVALPGEDKPPLRVTASGIPLGQLDLIKRFPLKPAAPVGREQPVFLWLCPGPDSIKVFALEGEG